MKWSEFVTADEYGMVNINKAYPGPGDGLKEVTAFAHTEYQAAEARDVELRLGCKNAWKIWHNGKLIFGRDEYHRGARIVLGCLGGQRAPGSRQRSPPADPRERVALRLRLLGRQLWD